MSDFQHPLRPPGAAPEDEFRRLCVRCGKCLEACPHNTLKLAGGFGKNRQTPYIEPKDTPCQLCMKCPPACPTGALDKACVNFEKVRIGVAHIIATGCHNHNNGPMCWTCYDRCPLRGKAMILKDGLTPAVVTDACAGCGVCANVCPQKCVVVVPIDSDYVPPDAVPGVKL